jgi:O-antigen/teichoic acid export membrane protein
MRRDVASAYLASGSRLLSWMIVSAITYRYNVIAFAMLAAVRATVGILSNFALGILPASIQLMAGSARDKQSKIYADAVAIAVRCVAVAALVTIATVPWMDRILKTPATIGSHQVLGLAIGFGCGIIIRWLGEPAAALIQTGPHLWLDNILQAAADVMWIVASALFLKRSGIEAIGYSYFAASGALVIARTISARWLTGLSLNISLRAGEYAPALLASGLLIALAQLADYLYAPTDYLLINHLLDVRQQADYAPAVQIDAGLMLLVSGLAATLLPKTAIAHFSGDRHTIRQYYLRGTLFTAATLLVAAVAVYFTSKPLLKAWLGNSMSGTRAILPLVLIHTVIGGSSAVGRSILLGIGKTRPFVIAVLIAGFVNVIASYCFVRYLHWGLKGIVAGTIVAVIGRCGIWMPFYVLKNLEHSPDL